MHLVNTVFTDLEHTENYRVNANKIAFFLIQDMMLTIISNGKTSFTVRFGVINLSCNPKITQENRLYCKFCGRTHLGHSSPWLLWEDLWSRYFVRPCQRSHQYQSFSQSNPPVATWKREMCIPGHHIRVSCVYFGFLFPFGQLLVFREAKHR